MHKQRITPQKQNGLSAPFLCDLSCVSQRLLRKMNIFNAVRAFGSIRLGYGVICRAKRKQSQTNIFT